jgi:hypothetical protein
MGVPREEHTAIFGMRESEIMLTESINQDHVCQALIAVGKPQQTTVAGVQERWMPYERPQTSCARLAAGLRNRRVSAVHSNRGHLHAAWPSATTSGQVGAMCSLPELRRGMRAVWGPRARPGPDRHAPWAKVRRNGVQERITPRFRPAICGVPGAGRRHVEGGQAHVLEVPGSAHSQAPPLSHADGAARQDRDSRTAM